MKDGITYSNILLKLYLRSLKNDGKLMYKDRIPYSTNMLATITRHPVGVVEKALRIFSELGLIEVLDNGAIFMADIQNYIGESSTEADRIRAYRNEIEENKQKLLSTNSVQMYDNCTPELKTEREIETDTYIDNIYCTESTDSAPRTTIPYKPIIDYLNSKAHTNFTHTSKSTQTLIKARYNEGRTIDDFKKVIDLKCDQWLKDEKMLPYIRPETLFNGKHFESYLNEKVIPHGQAIIKNQKKTNFSNYTQREYKADDLESRLTDDEIDDEAFQKAIASRKKQGGGICV